MIDNLHILEVRNNDDPSGSGLVKVREYNRENDEKEIPDEKLRWAHPVLPVTHITGGGVGTKPKAPPVGTRLVCFFAPDDHDKQYPFYLGCITRSEKVEQKGIQQRDPKTGAKTPEKPSPDQPGTVKT